MKYVDVLGIPILYIGIFLSGFFIPVVLKIVVGVGRYVWDGIRLRETRKKERLIKKAEEKCKNGNHEDCVIEKLFIRSHRTTTSPVHYFCKCKKSGELVDGVGWDYCDKEKIIYFRGISQTTIRKYLKIYGKNLLKSFDQYNDDNEGLKTRSEYDKFISNNMEKLETLKPYCDKEWLEENGNGFYKEKEVDNSFKTEVELDGY